MFTVRSPTPADRARVRERPDSFAVMYQRWRDLLFLHWEWDADQIQRTLPRGLHVDLHEGRCFLGVVPFDMRGVRPRFLPAVPGLSDFLELNLRTYVHDAAGLPGVWFYSLDANQRLAVAIARRFFHLPYYRATMRYDRHPGSPISFHSARGGDRGSELRYGYRARGAPRTAEPGSLEFFLLERYVLFADTPRGLRSGRVHHAPYPFREVSEVEWSEGLFSVDGFDPPGRAPDHAVMSPGVDVSIYPLRPGSSRPDPATCERAGSDRERRR